MYLPANLPFTAPGGEWPPLFVLSHGGPAASTHAIQYWTKRGFAVLGVNHGSSAYVAFEGEGHGFRKAANQQRALEAELYFYSRIFAFDPADPVPPLAITNL